VVDAIERFYQRHDTDPEWAEVPARTIIDAFWHALLLGRISHRIAGLDPKAALPDYFRGNELNSADPFVTVVGWASVEKDRSVGVVILPSGERLPILVHQQFSERWFKDEVHAYLVKQRAPSPSRSTITVSPTFNNTPVISPTITMNGPAGPTIPSEVSEQGLQQPEPVAETDQDVDKAVQVARELIVFVARYPKLLPKSTRSDNRKIKQPLAQEDNTPDDRNEWEKQRLEAAKEDLQPRGVPVSQDLLRAIDKIWNSRKIE
jgi:hypothetical protein